MRVTIVGQAPGPANGRRAAFEGPSGARLERLAGLQPGELPARARLVNLLGAWPGRAGKGCRFPAGQAREAARRLRLRTDVILLAGRGVAAAFGEGGRKYFEWFRLRRRWAAVVPHPSGVSHWWNDPSNRRRAARFMRSVLA